MTEKQDIVRQTFIQQAEACERLGSAFNGALCRLAAERLSDETAVGALILNWPGDPSNAADSVPLRLAGSLHALVLEELNDALVAAYPPAELDIEKLWSAVSDALSRNEDFLLERMKLPPQTNEVRRSAMIMPGFLEIARIFDKPLVLSELGASAGLNLNWDQYFYRLGDLVWGDEKSAVRLEPEFEGPAIEPLMVTTVERRGCDLNPLDPTDHDQQTRLLSYIWPDQADRLERTRAAFDVAAKKLPPVERRDAVSWLRDRLALETNGHVHVVFSTIAWQYLPEAARTEGALLMEMAGMTASNDAPIAWLQMEADGSQEGAALTLQLWPFGEKREIGRADFHGRWLKWTGWEQ